MGLYVLVCLATFISHTAKSETIATAAQQNNYPDPTAAKTAVTSFVSKARTVESVTTTAK